ncbi:MAG: cupin domain-containing protein [Candidatus Riflebacteria bacterium]|nr:cupin domain-containing protein [Candidatus Riflebacteria bacterium]
MKNTNFVSGTIALTLIVALLGSPSGVFAAKKQTTQPASVNFIAFDDSEYHTSPDKRIGAKILVDPAKVGPSISTLVHLTYLPGAHIGSHRHVFVTEIVHVLEGNLTLRIGDEIKILGPNSTAYIPAKSFHEYLNDSTDVVKFLQYYSPSGPEEEYRNWAKPSAEAETAAKVAPEKKPESTHVVTPALPVIPGSPTEVRLGAVEEKKLKTTTPDEQKTGTQDLEKTPPKVVAPASTAGTKSGK